MSIRFKRESAIPISYIRTQFSQSFVVKLITKKKKKKKEEKRKESKLVCWCHKNETSRCDQNVSKWNLLVFEYENLKEIYDKMMMSTGLEYCLDI